VYFGKKLLILDEPTSALSVKQTREVLNYVLKAKERGLSVIFITHNIAHVHEVADRFTIIRGGRKIGDFYKEEVNEMEVAQMVMTGDVPERLHLPEVVEE
jgi:simple sugar transport system ATP-binding protein